MRGALMDELGDSGDAIVGSQASSSSRVHMRTHPANPDGPLLMCMRMALFAPYMGAGAVAKVAGFGSTGLQWIIVVGLVSISVVIGLLMALAMPKFRHMQDPVVAITSLRVGSLGHHAHLSLRSFSQRRGSPR